MKLSIHCWRPAGQINPGDIVAVDNDPARPLHISEVRTKAVGTSNNYQVELYGRPEADGDPGRRRRLTYQVPGDQAMVLPDTDLAFTLWEMVRDATAGQLPPVAASMPGPLADDVPSGHLPVRPGDTEDTILVQHSGYIWNVKLHPEADATPPDSDDQGA